MFVTLQDPAGEYESTLATMRDVLPPGMFELLAPRGTEWDSPIVGAPFTTPDVPAAEIYNLRRKRNGKPEIDLRKERTVAAARRTTRGRRPAATLSLGSNSWAVSGDLTGSGRALVANDMHLDIRVPNTWYRAVLEWRDEADPSQTRLLAGLTLPGHPTLVTGSNTHVAWGFTNAQVDASDLVLIELDPMDPNRYWTPWGWRAFDRYSETIEVAGGDAVKMDVRWTIWGPVLGADHKGRLRAYAWTAHSAERLASSLLPLESARSIEEALEAANGLGTPAQNMIVADRSGRIGWTIYGTLPRRIGLSGQLPGIVGRRLARLERLADAEPSTRGSSTRRAAACGPPTPASWTAACSPRSATATTTWAPGRARSATGCASASSSRRATCSTSSSTRAPRSCRGGAI